MKLFLNNTSFLVSESLSKPLVALDEIDSIAQSIKTNMSKDITIPKDVLDSFKIKDSLNPEIWTGNVINPKITKKLIKIATDFFKDLNLPKQVLIKDIIFTGSLANFNWSKYSDIDLHVVLDFNQFDADPKMIESYFNAQKSIWNQEHDISVFNYPVELYIQDSKTKLRATSIYSLLKNKWVLKPKREQFQLDKKAIKDKADLIIFKLRDIRQDYNDHQYQSVVNKVTQLKHRIKRMRNSGLEKGGELSQENLVFKILRRTPFLDQLDSFRGKAYDKLMSVTETLNEGDLLQSTKFKVKRESEDEIVIQAINDSLIIGNISIGFLSSAYWKFEDDFSEEQYDAMFPNDTLAEIAWLEIKTLQHRGEGIAKKLMTLAIANIKKLGYSEIYLNASPIARAQGLILSDLVDFYKSFGFKEILHQGNNVQMLCQLNKPINENSKLTNFNPVSEQLEESPIHLQDGVILIKGRELEDGTQRLYAAYVKYTSVYNRLKVGDEPAQPVKMVSLNIHQNIYRLVMDGFNLKALGVGFNSPVEKEKSLGIKGNNIGINNNKTPQWWNTLQFTRLSDVLNKVGPQILRLPGIKWVG